MHAVTNVCIKHIYKVIYDLSVDLVTFDLGLTLKVKSRSQTFQGVCLINGASYDHSILTFDEIERANEGHWVFSGIYFIKY